jgi:hypothetical protein
LTGGSIDEVSSSTSAGVSDSKNSSSDTGDALFRSGGIANWAVEGRAFVALEGLGGIKIESWKAGASSLIGVEEESSLGIASNTGRWSNGSIKTSIGGAASNTASSAGIISLKVLRKSNIGEEALIDGSASHERDSDNNIGNSWVDVDSLEDLVNSVVGFSTNGVNKDLSAGSWSGSCLSIDWGEDFLVDCESIHFNLDAVVLSIIHSGNCADTVPSDLVGSIEITELKLDWWSSSKSKVGNTSSVDNGIIVSVIGSIVLKISSSITSSQSWGNCVFIRNTTELSIGIRVRIGSGVGSGGISALNNPFQDELLLTLGGNSEVIFLSNSGKEWESIIDTIGRRAILININSEDISWHEEIRWVGIRGANGVCVDWVKSSIDPDGRGAVALGVLGEIESSKTEDGVSVIGESHIVLVPVDIREVDLGLVTLLDRDWSIEFGDFLEDVRGGIGEIRSGSGTGRGKISEINWGIESFRALGRLEGRIEHRENESHFDIFKGTALIVDEDSRSSRIWASYNWVRWGSSTHDFCSTGIESGISRVDSEDSSWEVGSWASVRVPLETHDIGMNYIGSSDDWIVLVVPSYGSIACWIEDVVGIGIDVALITRAGIGEDWVDGIDFSVDIGSEIGGGGFDGWGPDGAVESIEVSGDDEIVEWNLCPFGDSLIGGGSRWISKVYNYFHSGVLIFREDLIDVECVIILSAVGLEARECEGIA